MDILDMQIIFDDIGRELLQFGIGPDGIRKFFEEEGDRVAQELEDEQ